MLPTQVSKTATTLNLAVLCHNAPIRKWTNQGATVTRNRCDTTNDRESNRCTARKKSCGAKRQLTEDTRSCRRGFQFGSSKYLCEGWGNLLERQGPHWLGCAGMMFSCSSRKEKQWNSFWRERCNGNGGVFWFLSGTDENPVFEEKIFVTTSIKTT